MSAGAASVPTEKFTFPGIRNISTQKYQEDAYISLVFLCKQIVFFFGSVLTSESDPLIPGGRDISISRCL